MADRLQGKVAVITGGASGMGKATALAFLGESAKVVVADLNADSLAAYEAEAAAAGHGPDATRAIRVDVAAEDDVAAMVALAVDAFGQLDVVFNNAGVGGAFGAVTDLHVEDWDYTFAVLTRSVFLGMKHASLAMKKHGGGVILVTASIAGMVGGGGSHAYSAAKAAVISLIENVAAELGGDRIRVVGIAPGVISTPLVHRGRPEKYEKQFSHQPWPDRGEPDVIADVASFLCSDEARFITGETIKVDGGLLAQGIALWGTGKDNTFMKSAGVNRGTTGEAMVVRNLRDKP
jgi:NAD(P)-dependent dehydrogenase (short-subunit alcohol dehydrogenase family)